MLTNAISEAIFEPSGFAPAAVALIYAFLARKAAIRGLLEISPIWHADDSSSTIEASLSTFSRRVQIVEGIVAIASFSLACNSRSINAVKVDAVMPVLRSQVISDNRLFQDYQSIS